MATPFDNATILRIDTPNGNTPAGDPILTTGSAVAIRCCQSDPTFGQRLMIEQMGLDATDCVFVEMALLPAIVAGSRILIQLDPVPGSAPPPPILFIVRKPKPSVMAGALSHWELYVKTA